MPNPAEATRVIRYNRSRMAVLKGESGDRTLQVYDPGSETVHLFDLTSKAAKEIGQDLFSSLTVAGPEDTP